MEKKIKKRIKKEAENIVLIDLDELLQCNGIELSTVTNHLKIDNRLVVFIPYQDEDYDLDGHIF